MRLAQRVLQELYELLQSGYPVLAQDVQYTIKILQDKESASVKDIFLDTVYISAMKRRISPKSLNQKRYIETIRSRDIVFGVGPAGTGKTYLAMAMAVAALMNNDVIRIVLARPAVEAGEKLGFLPGDLAEKVNPYLRPLYDALHDMMDFEKATRLVQRGTIEVAPLAFMRGRTLNDSFVILDEAQNTTSEQMMMFLTRLGFGSKAVITGDVTQIDLARRRAPGWWKPGTCSRRWKASPLSTSPNGTWCAIRWSRTSSGPMKTAGSAGPAVRTNRRLPENSRRTRASRPCRRSSFMTEKDVPKTISRIYGMGATCAPNCPNLYPGNRPLAPWQERHAKIAPAHRLEPAAGPYPGAADLPADGQVPGGGRGPGERQGHRRIPGRRRADHGQEAARADDPNAPGV